MSKIYKCNNCGKKFSKWTIKCQYCGSVDSLIETQEDSFSAQTGLRTTGAKEPTKRAKTLKELKNIPIKRFPTGIKELDRVLGGGFVTGEVVLFAGQPGAGKSTMSLSIANRYALKNKKVLYSSGEESEQQIALRAKRMNISSDNIKIINETNLEILLGHIQKEQPSLLIVDSLQTIASENIQGSLGGSQQSKECATTLTQVCKKNNITGIFINQIIKSGEFSGSESVQHIVDATLFLDSDKDSPLKFLRAHKNRFGDTTEVGVFQHTEKGLEEVSDPSEIFLSENNEIEIYGSSCSFISEGIRQMPVEIQALVTKSSLPTPRKQFNGINYNRGQIVCAILDKFCNGRSYDNDIFVSTVSGIKIEDPQADLSIAASILSSLNNININSKTAFVGELGLTGQVRGSFMIENKIKEAERLGFEKIIIPKTSQKSISKNHSIDIKFINSIRQLPKLLK